MEILGLPVFSAQPAENVGSFAAFPTLSPSMSRSHTDFDANIIRFISFDDPAQEAIDSQICINAGGPNLSYDQGSPSANDWVDVIQTITRAKEGIEDIGLVESETGSTERCRKRWVRPFVQGNNSYGRKGRKSCIPCRKWKRKCTYEFVDEICDLCKERGLPCSTKIWGPTRVQQEVLDGNMSLIVQPSPVSTPCERTRLLDRQISSISEIEFRHRYGVTYEEFTYISIKSKKEHGIEKTVGRCSVVSLPWPQFPVSSKAFRYAALAVASLREITGTNKAGTPDTLEYLSECYKHLQIAITNYSLVEVIVASYTMFLYQCIQVFEKSDCLDPMLTYLNGLCEAVHLSKQRGNCTPNDWRLVNNLWCASFHALQHVYSTLADPNPPLESELIRLEKLDNVFRNFSTVQLHCLDNIPYEPSGGDIQTQYTPMMRYYRRYLCFYLDYWLATRKHPFIDANSGSHHCVERSLQHILEQIRLSTGEQVFNVRKSAAKSEDIKAALLVGFAKLLEIKFFTESAVNHEYIQCAYDLYRLCQFAVVLNLEPFEVLPLTRYLFWIGLFLTKTIDIFACNWICAALNKQLNSFRLEGNAPVVNRIFEALLKFLETVNEIGDDKDILTLESEGLDLFRCNRLLEKLLL